MLFIMPSPLCLKYTRVHTPMDIEVSELLELKATTPAQPSILCKTQTSYYSKLEKKKKKNFGKSTP